ncbi:Lrp/AsnC family transcriptional regulator [Pseudooceanicola sp. C21-150M6]|uniref:Lrp/AsnC family transcriptional regulator n=1 Tax=Pseudooceanicola sp. C21-150M6 TaxID=3434355 RepID=UPI003D7F7FB1
MSDELFAYEENAHGRNHLRSAEPLLDARDLAILDLLTRDARLSRAEIARRIGLSAPAAGERIQRLEEAGIITGYHARIDPARLGYALTVIIRARPSPGRLSEMAKAIAMSPEITSCDRVSGEDCFIARAHVRSVSEMEVVIDRLIPFGSTNTALVQSQTVPDRPLPRLTRR